MKNRIYLSTTKKIGAVTWLLYHSCVGKNLVIKTHLPYTLI
ncbi:isopentenyl pyrophosphate isomerase [Rickettsia bellii OSU 85-389]|nr:isopentenyl pyrophosphate isomerase [Rickettsia bellii OSU 85-389]